jgi:signal peptidase I
VTGASAKTGATTTTGRDMGWPRVAATSAARAILLGAISLLLWSVAPLLLGWHPTVVMSGSMQPAVAPGDVLVYRQVATAELRAGQVLVVDDPDHPGRLRAHRLARALPDGTLRLRGDANPAPDSSPVDADAVRGVAVLRVPLVGLPAVWAADRRWSPLGLTAATMLALAVLAVGGPSRRRPGRRLTRRRAAAAAAAVALTATGVAADSPEADAAFARTTANSGDQYAAAAAFHPYRDAVTADAPTVLWRLNEASGTVAADYTGGDNGTYRGTYTLGAAGALASEPADKAVSSSAAQVTANNSSTAPSAFTVEAWVKTTSSAGGRLVGIGNQGGSTSSTVADDVLYVGTTGKAYFGVGTGKATVASPGVVNDGSWHHLAGTYSATAGMTLYVDGTAVAARAGALGLAVATGYWRAGADSLSGWTAAPTGTAPLNGSIDEVAIYPTALSATRIAAHRTAGITP